VKSFEYFFNILVVYRHIIKVNEYIIKIDLDTNIQKVREYTIHELLEDYNDINKTE